MDIRNGIIALFVVFGLFYCLYKTNNGLHLSFVAPFVKQQAHQRDLIDTCHTIDWSYTRFCTVVANNTLMFGTSFNLPPDLLRNYGIPIKRFVPIKRENLNDFIFVTAANKGYFHVAMDAIGNIQRLLSNHTIYFYDLDEHRKEEQIEKNRRLCQVIYRKFNYSRFPPHVRYLKNYAFKPLIVHEMLTEFPRVFWIDSSIRFNTDNLSLTLDEVFISGGILTFEYGGHSNFAATHEGMYRFLPIPVSAAANTIQYGANSIYFHRTEEMYTRIIVWWVLCALQKDCIASNLQLSCSFKGKDVWAGCHRFDQAAINILMAHHFQYNVSRYTSRRGQLTVSRRTAHRERVVVCPVKNMVKSAEYFT